MERAAAERGVALAFETLRPRLRDANAADVVLSLVDKAIDDERRHGDLCMRLAERYEGAAVPEAAPRGDGALPSFGTGDDAFELLLAVVGTCCINESIASEWIRSCFEASKAPLARAANRAHLQDEIDHARLGWAHLASTTVSDRDRLRLASWIPRLIAANVAEWKKPDRHLDEGGVPDHGHLAQRDTEAVVDAAVRDVIVPGFAHVHVQMSTPQIAITRPDAV